MIPLEFIESWRTQVKWQELDLIEHDLIISKALINLYSEPTLKNELVFRGGTALNKLFINPPSRYSEDLDFVYTKSEPIGDTLDAIRACLDPWLGEPKRQIDRFGAKLLYRYSSEKNLPMKLKIEINTTEKVGFLGLLGKQFSVKSEWFNGSCTIPTYQLEELMATKLRALFQRRKGRDLFDIAHIFGNSMADKELTISLFQKYIQREGKTVTGAQFHKNMLEKRAYEGFRTDMHILLPESALWNFDEAFDYVLNNVIAKIP
jgi:predicted nucleotidyltransferase component of viral defense system